jgi:hypothetical protein
MKRTFKTYLKAETGVAAIEFALIFPFMLLLYFGLLDLTGLVSAHRKMTSTASIVADLVGQNKPEVASASLTDYFKVIGMINNPGPTSGITVHIETHKPNGPASELRWQKTSTAGPGCTAVNSVGIKDLMDAGNDIIVTQACMTYVPFIATFLGNSILGQPTFKVESVVMVRPRSVAGLPCTDC